MEVMVKKKKKSNQEAYWKAQEREPLHLPRISCRDPHPQGQGRPGVQLYGREGASNQMSDSRPCTQDRSGPIWCRNSSLEQQTLFCLQMLPLRTTRRGQGCSAELDWTAWRYATKRPREPRRFGKQKRQMHPREISSRTPPEPSGPKGPRGSCPIAHPHGRNLSVS